MQYPRIIPCLLLKGEGLVKGIKFKDYTYIGDPINAIKIFNEKEVDELFFLDIEAGNRGGMIDVNVVRNVADECYMPFTVGGGVRNVEHFRDLLKAGAEKISINTICLDNPNLISEASKEFGNQSVVVSIDYRTNWFGKKKVFFRNGRKGVKTDLIAWAKEIEELGAGEILLNSIDRDGTMKGYDIDTIKQVSESVSIPVIACGGAGRLEHFVEAVKDGKASAVAGGSIFVYFGDKKGILINYPDIKEKNNFFNKIGHSYA